MTGLNIRPVLYVIGIMLTIEAVAMLAPMLADLAVGNRDWLVFGISAAVTLFFGVLLMLTNWTPSTPLHLRQIFVLTTLVWAVVCLFGALPFMFADIDLDLADAFFESMSGLTTTGSTVIVGLDRLPPGLLLWRSILQWLGGIGIIGMGIAVLPFLRVGGMQLFRSESSDRSDKVLPRAGDQAVALGQIYLLLTIGCIAALIAAGMSVFDAVCHAMTTVSTGGFSTHDASAGHFGNPLIEWILVLFMALGGMPFVRYISILNANVRPLWRDTQVRWYIGFLATISLVLGGWLSWTGDVPFADAIRSASFNVVSVVTTTGFATEDYGLWGPLAVVAFLVLTLVGGCTGSTSGGIKIFRFEILFKALHALMARLVSPNRIIPLAYDGKPVDSDVMISVMAFGFVFVAGTMLVAMILAAMGLDAITAISGAATAFANVGPGLGPIIGPVGKFATLPVAAKWLLSLSMLLGRLEFFTVLVLLNPRFWIR